jgi:hypothetical protein
MKRYEITGYSAVSYEIYHLGISEGENPEEAWKNYKGPRKFGSEPIGMKIIMDPATHKWGKGYR